MHDVLDLLDTVPDELDQLLTSGYVVPPELHDRIRSAAAGSDRVALESARNALATLQRRQDWPWVEPSDRASILAQLEPLPVKRWSGSAEDLADRIAGAWTGRCIGCVMGKPVEGLTGDETRLYLTAAGSWPLLDYVPLLGELPAGVSHLHESAPDAARGRFPMTPRDDDIDYTILALHIVETYGRGFSSADVAREWLDRLPFTQTFTAERAAYRNLIHGWTPPATATVHNPYREWIGALIRGDLFGYISPGDPASAVAMAIEDAVVSHVSNGIYGEMWSAALIAAAFTADDARQAVEVAASYLPPGSRMRASQLFIFALRDSGASWEEAVSTLREHLGGYNWVHTINNAAVITCGLLWGEGEAVASIGLTVQAGWDTDSNGATVGSVMGALHGAAAMPQHLVAPLGGRVRSAVRDYDGVSIDTLAQRTLVLVEPGAGAS